MKKMKEVLHRSTALLLAFLLVVSFGTQFQASAYEQKTGVVNTQSDPLTVRSGPGTTYQKLGSLPRGTNVTIVDEANADDGALWYKIDFQGNYGFVSAKFVKIVSVDKDDADFESMVAQFPESYRDDLWEIHALYPNWVFKPVFTHTNWEDALQAESALGHSLVHTNSVSSWKSTKPGAYDWSTSTWAGFDGPSWVQASDEILAYYMDPRSYLDSNYVFAFLDYSYDASQTKEGLANIVKGTFMEGGFEQNGKTYSYVDVIMDAAQKYTMNPYVIATIIRNELGVNGSKSISGTVPGYEGYYNYYNIGAYATSTMSAIERGLWYAKGGNNGSTSYNRPWNNRYDAVLGGANFYSSNYVGHGQNTIYLKKFNVIGSDKYPPYTHEYMTNVPGAASEGRTLAKAYDENARAEKLIFEIPVFDNMPATATKKPVGDGSPNNKLANITVNQSGLTPGFDKDTLNYDLVLDAGIDEIVISATALDSAARIEGTGTFKLQNGSNVFNITVIAQNGQKRVYTIDVVADLSKPNPPTPQPPDPGVGDATINPNLKVSESNKTVSGFPTVPYTADQVAANMGVSNGSVQIVNASGNVVTGNVGTGAKVRILRTDGSLQTEYTVVVYGDANGDGRFTSVDLLRIQKHILHMINLGGAQLAAADANHDGKITSVDLLRIQKTILHMSSITQ